MDQPYDGFIVPEQERYASSEIQMGRWIRGSIKVLEYFTSIVAELWSLKDGLKIIRELEIDCLIVERITTSLKIFRPEYFIKSTFFIYCRER